jgi:hypothetical protein
MSRAEPRKGGLALGGRGGSNGGIERVGVRVGGRRADLLRRQGPSDDLHLSIPTGDTFSSLRL